MDESWRKRQPAIHPHRSTKDLGPDDFHDVFGGPPRSVLLRNFSSTNHYGHNGLRIIKQESDLSYNPNFYNSDHNGFRVIQREADTPCYNTGLYKLDRVSTSRYEHNMFHVVKSETDLSYDTLSHNSDHGSKANHAQNGFRVMKKEDETLSCKTGCHKSDHVYRYGQSGFRIPKREEEISYNINFGKSGHNGFWVIPSQDEDDGSISEDSIFRGSDRFLLDQGARNGFLIMKKEDSVDSNLNFHKSNHVSSTNHYAHNGFRVMKMDKNNFSNEAFGYRVSNKNPLDNRFHPLKREEEFYNDIYGSNIRVANAGLRRSRSRSISKHGSEPTTVSCCDEDDRQLASFAAKLRPITIPSRRYDSSPSSTLSEELANSTLRISTVQCPSSPLTHLKNDTDSKNACNSKITYKNRCNNSSFCCFTPPETDSLDPSFRLSFQKKLSSEDNSPCSVVSSHFPCKVKEVEKKVVLETDRGLIENKENEKGSFVIKIDNFVKLEKERSVGSEAAASLDEAIAWAKEKFMNQGKETEGKNEKFVGFRDWNEKSGKECRESKER